MAQYTSPLPVVPSASIGSTTGSTTGHYHSVPSVQSSVTHYDEIFDVDPNNFTQTTPIYPQSTPIYPGSNNFEFNSDDSLDALNLQTRQIQTHVGAIRNTIESIDTDIDKINYKIHSITQALDVESKIKLQKHPIEFVMIIFVFFMVLALWQDVFLRSISKIFGKTDLGLSITAILAITLTIILWGYTVYSKGALFAIESSE